MGCNIFAFLGLMTGTWISGLSGDSTFPFLGMQAYSVQFTTLGRGLLMGALGAVLVTRWRRFEKDENVALADSLTPVNHRLHLRLLAHSVGRKLRYYTSRLSGGK